jgi:hypothetical protein
MRHSLYACSARSLLVLFPLLTSIVSAERVIVSSALEECQSNSTFTASLFDIVFTPDNRSVSINVVGDSSVQGNVTLRVNAAAYGYTFLNEALNPCTEGFQSLCPLQDLQINFDSIYSNLSMNVIGKIPGVAYGIPDLDATVTVYMAKIEEPDINLACVQSRLSNGKTVYQSGVGWATAVVAILGLLTAAVVSGFGHLNAASHVAVYALSLFNYFQAVAIVGLCAVPLPPIVQSWTQDFSWSMGIIRVEFLQTLATWYLIATGGKPATVLATLATKSVQVVKRGLDAIAPARSLYPRADTSVPTGEYVVKGIERVAFRAGMESTNLFLTGIIFFLIFVIFTVVGVMAFNEICKLAIRARWMKSHRFESFRADWVVTLKGIIFRILLICYPQLMILCLWEFTRADSAAEVLLAVFIFFGVLAALCYAAFQVILVAKRSELLHHTPAYMLYANPVVLNKWGFLYIQFRASSYFYIVPTLAYVLIKAMFVGLGQGSGTVQAVALVVIEAVALICASVFRPWMDKPTIVISISICAVNFVNAVLLLIFTGIFNGPGLLVGVAGVVFFVVNAVFALVLLLVVLTAVVYSIIQSDPEMRYQPVADNRASFIKSQTALTTELDALGAAARGGTGMSNYGEKLDAEDSSDHDLHADTFQQQYGLKNTSYRDPMHSPTTPLTPSMPMLPTDLPPGARHLASSSRPGSYASNADSEYMARNDRSYPEFRSQNNNS